MKRVVAEGNFTVEEIRESDYEELDSDNDDVIRPDHYEDAESETARSVNGRRSSDIDPNVLSGLRNLDCDDPYSYPTYETWMEARRQEKRRKRRSSSSLHKRTLSQSIGSDTDDEDLQPQHLDISEVGSSARRLRRKLAGERTSLIFDDPPPRIEELEEPESCESVVDVGEDEEDLAQLAQGQQAQGQPAGQAQQQQRPQQRPQIMLFKPENMRSLPDQFTQQEKEKWEAGLKSLWNQVEKNGPDTPIHQEAKRKLYEFSKTLQSKIQQYRAQQQAAMMRSNSQNPQQAGQQQGENAAAGNQAAAPNAPTAAQAAATAQAKIPQKLMDHVNGFPYVLPTQLTQGTPEAAKWLQDVKSKYLKGLLAMDNAQNRLPRPQMTAPASNPALQSTQAVNAAIEAARNQQMGAARPPMQVPQNGQNQQGQPQAVPSLPNGSQPPSGPVANIKTEGGVLPQLNTGAAVQRPMQNSPQSAVPQSAGAVGGQPQSATSAGPPRPLTHQAALQSAARSYSNSQASAGPNVMGHGHPHPPRETTNVITNKMPIPKTLPERATAPPQPVPMPQTRPSYSGGPSNAGQGVMGQPVMPKPPGYNLESEGERVLSKKKLDELVRQVTGGGDVGGLTAEVEESILTVADCFVDQVLHAACKNAKERGSKILEIRDIQLTLERCYNIRIPGYASDEIRTVRKIQPSPAWIAKMSAVQAAKVTGGKGGD
ncbi:hypothetical protein DH86_00002090 [Scytalidium sp. 3C]|nr:hypothetical protein DH86_00002090 [Scytalidium sp. 3C]